MKQSIAYLVITFPATSKNRLFREPTDAITLHIAWGSHADVGLTGVVVAIISSTPLP